MKKLNVFNTIWHPWRYPSNWISNIKIFFRQFKWAYQRITKGFCDYDIWDMDVYLIQLLADGIKQLADTSWGYPCTEEFPTHESWQEYLYKICDLLNYSLSELPNEYEEDWLKIWKERKLEAINHPTKEEKEISDKYLDLERKNDKLKIEAQNKALKMIYHIFNNLWD